MLTPEELRALLLLTVNCKSRIDGLVALSTDALCMIEPTLTRCEHSSCKAPATVKHVDLGVKMCDYHAASGILKAVNDLKQQGIVDTITLLKIRIGDEECWADLPNAPRIRRIIEFVDAVRQREEPEPPADPNELH